MTISTVHEPGNDIEPSDALYCGLLHRPQGETVSRLRAHASRDRALAQDGQQRTVGCDDDAAPAHAGRGLASSQAPLLSRAALFNATGAA